MTETKTRVHAGDVLERYGSCLELVSMDTNFHNISVALYVKDWVCTVWTFSQREGVQERIERIRDNIVDLGGLEPIKGTHHQVRFGCGHLHVRPLKFLMSQAVGKARDYAQPGGDMTIKDTKTKLILAVQGRESDGQWVYEVSATGEAPNPMARLRLVVAGFVRYGEMEKVSDTVVTFPCGQRHDQMLRVLLPYSRNVSGVESMIEAEALRGQMTTGTLGFTPPT